MTQNQSTDTQRTETVKRSIGGHGWPAVRGSAMFYDSYTELAFEQSLAAMDKRRYCAKCNTLVEDGYGYKVAEIEYLGGRISHLIITKNGSVVYSFHEEDEKTIDEKMAQMVLTMAEDAKNKEVLNAMGIRTPADVKKMTMTQYAEFARRCNDD